MGSSEMHDHERRCPYVVEDGEGINMPAKGKSLTTSGVLSEMAKTMERLKTNACAFDRPVAELSKSANLLHIPRMFEGSGGGHKKNPQPTVGGL